jgi:prepilin-type N-terminal cleavage/methylation domain-containing protein
MWAPKRSIRPARVRCGSGADRLCAFTLLELLIVIALMVVLAWFVVPVFTGELDRRRLDDSISQVQSLVLLTRAHAMNDGKRYRIRWPDEANYAEAEEKGTTLQPIVEVENDPIEQPGIFTPVEELWATGETLHPGIQCLKVVLGRNQPDPNQLAATDTGQTAMSEIENGAAEMFEEESEIDKMFEEDITKSGTVEEIDPNRPPVTFEADGTTDWGTIYLTNGTQNEDGEPQTWEIYIDGRTGNVGWRRTLSEAEREQALSDAEDQKQEHKIVRGRELGAR